MFPHMDVMYFDQIHSLCYSFLTPLIVVSRFHCAISYIYNVPSRICPIILFFPPLPPKAPPFCSCFTLLSNLIQICYSPNSKPFPPSSIPPSKAAGLFHLVWCDDKCHMTSPIYGIWIVPFIEAQFGMMFPGAGDGVGRLLLHRRTEFWSCSRQPCGYSERAVW
jgi:hypothetical protein